MDMRFQQLDYERSLESTLRLFKGGRPLSEIAAERKLSVGTIENHLVRLLDDGKVNIRELLDDGRIREISSAAEGCGSLKAIKSKLPDDVGYGEIRFVLAHLGRSKPRKRQIESAVNTYVGNYCMRKCFNHPEILEECRGRFGQLVEGMANVPLSFGELRRMIDDGSIQVCKLPPERRRLYVSWRSFEHLKESGTDFWEQEAA